MKLSASALAFLTLTLICASLHIAHASQNAPLREKIIAIDSYISNHNKEASSNPGVSQVVTKHTIVYPAYGYITTYTWEPCTDEDDQVVFSGGFKLQQTNDSSAAKFYIKDSYPYGSKGWTWKVTNTNNTNLAMDLYVQCGEQPYDYGRATKTNYTVAGTNSFYVSCPESGAKGISAGFSVPSNTGFSDNDAGFLGWITSQSGQTVKQSVVCGYAWGFWLFGTFYHQPIDGVGYDYGTEVKIPAGSKSTTATARCYRNSTYYDPLAVGFYSDASATGLQLIASYASGTSAYITLANSGTVDVLVTPIATCDGVEW